MIRPPDPAHSAGLSGLVLLWDENVFGTERPLRLFLQQVGAPLCPSLLWLDHWYSGLVTRTLAPFWRGQVKKIPPSFLFFPGEGPFPNGFIVLPFKKNEVSELAKRLRETVEGLMLTPVVLDSESLTPEIKPFIQEISQKLLEGKEIRLYVSDPAAHPASYVCMTFAGVAS